ncbi:MAG: hypothetical protein K2O66_01220 [Bacteroidales bacterium]|nr:hypothetical protein [Bacteroidales bacterium]MDE7071970.1 hypothetical protein [Bacteroidales bacterium]
MEKKENAATESVPASKKPSENQRIEEWKRKYGKVFCYEVEGQQLYFRQPDRKTLAAAGVIAKNDPMKYNEFVLKNSFLGGNAELLEDNSVFYGLSQIMDKLVAAKIGELKNL